MVSVALLCTLAFLAIAPSAVQAGGCDDCCRFGLCDKVINDKSPGQCCGRYNNTNYCCPPSADATCALVEATSTWNCESTRGITLANVIIVTVSVVICIVVAFLIYDWYRKNKSRFEFQVEQMTADPTTSTPTEQAGPASAKKVLEKPIQELGWDNLELDPETGMFVLNEQVATKSGAPSIVAARKAPR